MQKKLLVTLIILAFALIVLQPSRRIVSSVSFLQLEGLGVEVSVFQNTDFEIIGIFSDSRGAEKKVVVDIILKGDFSDKYRVAIKGDLHPSDRVKFDIKNEGEYRWERFSGGVASFLNVVLDFDGDPRFRSDFIVTVCDLGCSDIKISGDFILTRNFEYGFRLLWNLMSV